MAREPKLSIRKYKDIRRRFVYKTADVKLSITEIFSFLFITQFCQDGDKVKEDKK